MLIQDSENAAIASNPCFARQAARLHRDKLDVDKFNQQELLDGGGDQANEEMYVWLTGLMAYLQTSTRRAHCLLLEVAGVCSEL